jgi:glycosyltransferase involved in cell wall biosynthesis
MKRLLLKQVDLFVLYFRNVDGYVREFGLPRERVVYVPFKVNSWDVLRATRPEAPVGDYVLLSGATLRDHATFVEAVRQAGVPAVILLPGDAKGELESMPWYRAGVPQNLRIDFHTDGKETTYLRYFEEARIVCFPRFAWDIASSGISGYLCSMALGKFVAISRGPGAEDVLEEPQAAAFFNPGNAQELARLIRQAWDDDGYRNRIAANGARYADQLEDENRLLRDVVAVLVRAGTRSD